MSAADTQAPDELAAQSGSLRMHVQAIRVLEKITDGFLALGPDWRVLYVNQEAERLNGMRREEMIGRNHWDLFPAAVGTTIHSELLRAARDQVAVEFENHYLPSNRWFHVKAYPAEEGGLSVFFGDITERKRAEDALRAGEEGFRAIVETTSEGVQVIGRDGVILQVNSAAVSMSGAASPGELLGRSIYEMIAPRDTRRYRAFHAGICGGGRGSLEYEVIGADGVLRRFETHARPLLQPDGTVAELAVSHDIGDRWRRERASLPLSAIVDSTEVAIISRDLSGIITGWNRSAERMFGYTSKEAIGKPITIITPEERLDEEARILARVSEGESIDRFETVRRRKGGALRNISLTISPVRDATGRIVGASKIARDITEIRSLERASLLFSAIVDSSDDAILSKDLNGVITSWNRGAERLFGYSAAEAIGKSIMMLIPEDRRDEEPRILGMLRAGERIDHFETVRRRKDGQFRNVSLTISPIIDAEGKVIGASKIARDVTEIRQAERAALLLAAIVGSSDDAIVSKDLNGVITSWNKSAERLFGFTAAEAVGHPITIIIPRDRLGEEANILSRLRRGERIEHFETIRQHKNGSPLEVSITISPVKNAGGEVIGASKIARDISDRKRAEKAIAALNAQLAADLATMTRMQQLSTRLLQAGDFQQLLGDIIEAGIDIAGAHMGNIQLVEKGTLGILVQRGFEQPFLDFFAEPENAAVAACGEALGRGIRVAVEDVASSPIFDQRSREVILQAGVRAVQATPLVSRSGKILGVLSTHSRVQSTPSDRQLRMLDILARLAADLIERKTVEAALLQSEARFRQLADAMPQIVWTARPDGFIDYYNDRWRQFTGADRNRLGDLSLAGALHPDDFPGWRASWYSAVQSGQPWEIEYRLRDGDSDRWRWFISRAVPVQDEKGQIVKWFGSATDIDEQKRTELDLRRANVDLEQFAYSASHDLREPLRSIRIYSELLEARYGGRMEGAGVEFLQYLRTGAKRMESLVNDLLQYTQATRFDAPAEPLSAENALNVALHSLEGGIAENKAVVMRSPLPDVRVHGAHLRQIFQNLIGNAIKYRHPERPSVVEVTGNSHNGWCTFAVTDNGIGIEAEYREYIFGLFKRLHTGDEYSGTGIGLAICQRIVDRYHGRIWVESQPGKGSTFFFAVPC